MTLYGQPIKETSISHMQKEVFKGADEVKVKGGRKIKIKAFKDELYQTVKKRKGINDPRTFNKEVLQKEFGIQGGAKEVGIRKAMTEEYEKYFAQKGK